MSAASSLEVPITPVFRGPGRTHLDGAGERLWRQWSDYGFGRLLAVDAEPGIAVGITRTELAGLVRSAGRVLEV